MPSRSRALAALTATWVLGLAPAVTAHAQGFTVMTWNIAHARVTHNDLAPIGRTIARQHPDVVGLQEVDRSWSRSGSVDQASLLGVQLRMFKFFDLTLDCRGADLDGDGTCQYGTAILSRRPLGGRRTYFLRGSGNDEPRGLARASVFVGGHRITIFNTHLGKGHSRALQIRHILRVLAHTRGPYVLMGDFNARPAGPPLDRLLQRVTDAARVRHVRRPTIAGTRLDYVFVSRDLSVLAARIPRLPPGQLSDHRPVIVRLRVKPPPVRT